MSETRYLSELFHVAPPHWGSRGDPWLWKDMEKEFSTIPFPYSAQELTRDIKEIFKKKTGVELENSAHPFVQEYVHKDKEKGSAGMSSGVLSGKFWLNTAIPLLLSLRDIAVANMSEFDEILKAGTAAHALRTPPCDPAGFDEKNKN